MNIQKFIKSTYENGGCSYNLHTGVSNPDSGYMVSVRKTQYVVDVLDAETLRKFIETNIEDIASDNLFVGSWVSDGKVYLDVSELILSKEQAIKSGMLRDQLAIYDNANGKDINLPTRQKCGTWFQQQTYINLKVQELCS